MESNANFILNPTLKTASCIADKMSRNCSESFLWCYLVGKMSVPDIALVLVMTFPEK